MEWLTKLSDLHKLPTRYIGLVAIVTGALLFSPTWFLDRLHLSIVPAPYGAVIGIAFLLSSGMVLVNSFGLLFDASKRRGWSKKRKKMIEDALSQLDPVEQAVLREFMLTGVSTLKIPMDNPSVVGLESKGILERVGRYGNYAFDGMMFPYRISATANELITPELLGLSGFLIEVDSGQFGLTQEGKEWIDEHRPGFVESRRRNW